MKFIIAIPALEKNRYSKKGDLVNWGSSSLLEWKISQAKKVKRCKKIFVISSSKKIKSLCDKMNVNYIGRKNKIKNIADLHYEVGKIFKNFNIVWLNPTYPFLKPEIIDKFIKIFVKQKKSYDSLFASFSLNEYLFIKKKAINFDPRLRSISRKNVKQVKQVINSICIIKGEKILKYKNLFGQKTNFKEVDWLSTLEIKTLKDKNLFEKLIGSYFTQL